MPTYTVTNLTTARHGVPGTGFGLGSGKTAYGVPGKVVNHPEFQRLLGKSPPIFQVVEELVAEEPKPAPTKPAKKAGKKEE